jgi:hypothetical protein
VAALNPLFLNRISPLVTASPLGIPAECNISRYRHGVEWNDGNALDSLRVAFALPATAEGQLIASPV